VLAASARTIVNGADQAVSVLPGGPLMAVALRGGASAVATPLTSSPLTGTGSPMVTSSFAPGAASGPNKVTQLPEGPGASAGDATSGGMAGAIAGAGTPGVEGALAQSQEMNLYFLQIQEQVNAQDRAYTAYSNVLKAEHDTVMTAVGNIR
jgi:hypothetical protein